MIFKFKWNDDKTSHVTEITSKVNIPEQNDKMRRFLNLIGLTKQIKVKK